MNFTVTDLHRCLSRLFLSLILLTSASAQAEDPQSQVAAEAQGVAVAISNWTSQTISNEGEHFIGEPTIGPGFPETILPYQNTGTGVRRRTPALSGEPLCPLFNLYRTWSRV